MQSLSSIEIKLSFIAEIVEKSFHVHLLVVMVNINLKFLQKAVVPVVIIGQWNTPLVIEHFLYYSKIVHLEKD